MTAADGGSSMRDLLDQDQRDKEAGAVSDSMQLANSADRYGIIPQFLHWLTVILVAVAWALGMFDDAFPKGAAKAVALLVHVSAGLTILVVLFVRLVWRVADPPPAPESSEFGRWLGAFADPAAKVAHYALYALLIVVPVTGIVLQFARGDALPILGIWEIASPWVRDRNFARDVKEVHEIAANFLVIVALLHAAAAVIHHLVFHDNTLVRMLPRRRK